MTCHYFVFDQIKLEKSMLKLQTAATRFGGARMRSEKFTKSPRAAMLSYERARIDFVSLPLASRFSVSSDSSWPRCWKIVRVCLP